MYPGLTEAAWEGVFFGSVGFVKDRARVGGTRVRILAWKKKEKLQNGEKEQREKERERK